jgi:hypothetical protein
VKQRDGGIESELVSVPGELGSGITINVPLFKKLRDIIFFLRDNNFLSHFEAPSKCPEKWLKKLLSQKKNYVPKFLKQRDIGNFMSFCNHGPSIMSRSFLNLIN